MIFILGYQKVNGIKSPFIKTNQETLNLELTRKYYATFEQCKPIEIVLILSDGIGEVLEIL